MTNNLYAPTSATGLNSLGLTLSQSELYARMRLTSDWREVLDCGFRIIEQRLGIPFTKIELPASSASSIQERQTKAEVFGSRAERIIRARIRGTHTEKQWLELIRLCGCVCVKCKKPSKLSKDHIFPVSLGGSDHITNLQPLCQSCNSSKMVKVADYRPHEVIAALKVKQRVWGHQ